MYFVLKTSADNLIWTKTTGNKSGNGCIDFDYVSAPKPKDFNPRDILQIMYSRQDAVNVNRDLIPNLLYQNSIRPLSSADGYYFRSRPYSQRCRSKRRVKYDGIVVNEINYTFLAQSQLKVYDTFSHNIEVQPSQQDSAIGAYISVEAGVKPRLNQDGINSMFQNAYWNKTTCSC